MNKTFRHYRTITKHRHLVIKNAKHVGLFWHCLRHDLSKYSKQEFNLSVKYYTGVSTPINGERADTGGYSSICQHHNSKNKHHWQYWTDFFGGNIVCKTMPYKYALECVCDMISASMVYKGKTYTRNDPLDYFVNQSTHYYLTRATEEFIKWCLSNYAESEWQNLKKKITKTKYLEITSKYPDVEIVSEIRGLIQ